MPYSRFHRYLRIPLLVTMLFAGVVVAAQGLEVGDRVFGSQLAKDIKYDALFHGKVNLLVAHYSDPDHKTIDMELVEEYKARFGILLAWRQVPNPAEEGLVIVDKSGYVRWKGRHKDLSTIDDVIREELAKLKRDIPLIVGSSAPDFYLTETDGKTEFKLSDYKGKKNVLVSLLLQTY